MMVSWYGTAAEPTAVQRASTPQGLGRPSTDGFTLIELLLVISCFDPAYLPAQVIRCGWANAKS